MMIKNELVLRNITFYITYKLSWNHRFYLFTSLVIWSTVALSRCVSLIETYCSTSHVILPIRTKVGCSKCHVMSQSTGCNTCHVSEYNHMTTQRATSYSFNTIRRKTLACTWLESYFSNLKLLYLVWYQSVYKTDIMGRYKLCMNYDTCCG